MIIAHNLCIINQGQWEPWGIYYFQNKLRTLKTNSRISQKNSRIFTKKTQGFEENSNLWRQLASGCLLKIGQKISLIYVLRTDFLPNSTILQKVSLSQRSIFSTQSIKGFSKTKNTLNQLSLHLPVWMTF